MRIALKVLAVIGLLALIMVFCLIGVVLVVWVMAELA